MLQTFISKQDKDHYNDLLSSACAKLCECNKACENEKSPLPLQAYIHTTVTISESKSFCGVTGLGKKLGRE